MNNDDVSRVLGLEMELLRPDARRSVEWLSSVLADDFLELGASGRQYRKADILRMLPSEDPTTFEVSDISTQQPADDSILVLYRVEKTRSGVRTSSLRTSLWRNRDNAWQLVFHQGTPIQKQD